jgi:predicted outer membrane repeat protein
LNLTINGNNAVIEGQPGWSNRILSISSNAVVAISNVVFRNGNAGGGGGILNSGTLSLLNCQILDNTATSTGGGILNTGTLVVTNTVVVNNTVSGDVSQSPQGGGIYSNGKLTISNSAIISNTTAEGRGGGVSVDQNATVTILKNVTLSGNRAVDGGGLYYASPTPGGLSYVTVYRNTATNDGGGIFGAQTIALTGTIVAGNVATPTLAQDCSGNIASNGYNLTQTDCGLHQITDKTGNPALGPLQDNGGPTPTHAIANTSKAYNQIPHLSGGCGTTITIDQRGIRRPQSSGCDIGAFELEVNLPPVAWLPLVRR